MKRLKFLRADSWPVWIIIGSINLLAYVLSDDLLGDINFALFGFAIATAWRNYEEERFWKRYLASLGHL